MDLLKMYSLLKIGIFQAAMLVYRRVYVKIQGGMIWYPKLFPLAFSQAKTVVRGGLFF